MSNRDFHVFSITGRLIVPFEADGGPSLDEVLKGDFELTATFADGAEGGIATTDVITYMGRTVEPTRIPFMKIAEDLRKVAWAPGNDLDSQALMDLADHVERVARGIRP
jgi:hypothetical protein